MLNIVLLLRKLWSVKAEGVPMHIVGENQEDMTSRLALAPKRGPGAAGGHEPDFVNSQAVAARALVQTLAYPIISPAVKDLFNEAEDSADIVTTFASEYVPLNVEMKFGVVRASVLRAQGERSICIGILWSNGDPALLPPHDSDVKFCDTDRLVVLRRLHKQSCGYFQSSLAMFQVQLFQFLVEDKFKYLYLCLYSIHLSSFSLVLHRYKLMHLKLTPLQAKDRLEVFR